MYGTVPARKGARFRCDWAARETEEEGVRRGFTEVAAVRRFCYGPLRSLALVRAHFQQDCETPASPFLSEVGGPIHPLSLPATPSEEKAE
jgi:hypothetical protein